MAGGKLDSRQKMINMMYLVFIAMLALNISKEVLATLGLINSDIVAATQDLVSDSNAKYTLFSNNANNEYYKIAAQSTPEIQVIADEYFNYLDTLKQRLINTSETGYKMARENKKTGEIDSIIDYQIMDKSQYLDELFFTGDQYSENGQEFVDRFSSFPAKLQNVLDVFVAADLEKDPPTEEDPDGEYIDFDFGFLSSLNDRFAYSEMVLNREGTYQPYLNYHFEGFPLIASLSKLTKIQSDIRYIENKILEYILITIKQQQGIINANTYFTLIDSEKTSFYTGEVIDASVVTGKKDSNWKPDDANLFIDNTPLVEGTDFIITPGGIKLNKKIFKPGVYKLTGEMFFELDKKKESIPVNHSIKIIEEPNDAVISNENMKSLYVGLDNPLNISMPGVSKDKIRVVPENGSITKIRDVWNAKPTGDVGQYMYLTVIGQLDGNRPPITAQRQRFKIKSLPPAECVLISGEDAYTSNDVITNFSLTNAKIDVEFKDFDYEVVAKVTSYKVELSGRSSIELQSSNINSNTQLLSYIRTARSGTSVRFYDIEVAAVTESGQPVPAPKSSEFTIKIR